MRDLECFLISGKTIIMPAHTRGADARSRGVGNTIISPTLHIPSLTLLSPDSYIITGHTDWKLSPFLSTFPLFPWPYPDYLVRKRSGA